MSAGLLRNSDCGPLHRVSLRHAIRMLFREVAVVHEAEPDRQIGVYPIPTVVRLGGYGGAGWGHSRGPRWSRAGVLARDKRSCGYCGAAASTIDHVLPRSRGGRNEWVNTVAACGRCNNRKGDRTPGEARMSLLVRPYAPTWFDA